MKKLNNKGATWIWITVIIGLSFLAILYIPLFDIFENYLYPLGLDATKLNTDLNTTGVFRIMWLSVPFAMIFTMAWWGLSQAQKKNEYY